MISWPSQGVVQDYIDNFIHYIKQKLAKGDVYLVFDRYNEYSIKDVAKCCREETGSKKYKLRPDTTQPKKTIVLTVTTNKVQLIDVICQQLCVKIQNLPLSEEGTMHKFVLTGKDPSPVEISQGYLSVLVDQDIRAELSKRKTQASSPDEKSGARDKIQKSDGT